MNITIIYESIMSLQHIPAELIFEITKLLTLSECNRLRHALKLSYINDVGLLANSQLYFKPRLLELVFKSQQITEKQLLTLLKYSSLNPAQTYNLMYNIDQDLITKDNKMHLVIQYKVSCPSDINYEKIKNSTKLIQIMMLMIEHRFDENNLINNPYCYIYSLLNDLLINYFTEICELKYNASIRKHVTSKFRNILYHENIWYRTNLNLYIIFVLYLINLDIISYKYLKKIRKDIKHGHDIIKPDSVYDINNSNIIVLFNCNDAMAVAYSTMFEKFYTSHLRLYYMIMQSSEISAFMKSKIANQISSR